MKARPPLWYTLQAVLSWIFEELLLAAVVLWLLPRFFHVNIPLWGLILLMLVLAAVSATLYSIGRRTFFISPKGARDNIVGSEGTVVKRLAPEGYVKVQGVLWKATSAQSEVGVGREVVVTGIEGLKLVVTPKNTQHLEKTS